MTDVSATTEKPVSKRILFAECVPHGVGSLRGVTAVIFTTKICSVNYETDLLFTVLYRQICPERLPNTAGYLLCVQDAGAVCQKTDDFEVLGQTLSHCPHAMQSFALPEFLV